LRRFFVEQPLAVGDEAELGRELAHRLGRVLRLEPGAQFILVNGSDQEFEARLSVLTDRSAVATIVGQQQALAAAKTKLVLYQSLIKAARFEWILEKATELGVASIIPLTSERSVVRAEGEGTARWHRWQRIVVEAAEQCGRSEAPALGSGMALAEAVETAPGLRLFSWEEAGGLGLGESLQAEPYPPDAVSLFVGPEGGFTPDEAALAAGLGAKVVSLGRRILRAETAAIVSITIAMETLGELGSGKATGARIAPR